MALVHEIIKDAYRESNLIPITQSPTLDEQAEALRLLNRFVRSVFGNEAGDKLQSFAVGTNNIDAPLVLPLITVTGVGYSPLNSRLVCNLESATSANLHPDPEDGARLAVIDASNNFNTNNLTLVGNGRTIGGAASLVLSTAGIKREWFYRADLGDWQQVTDLSLNDTFPFPLEFEDMFVIGLAMRLNPRNGASIDEQGAMNYRRQRALFRARYSQSIQQASEEGLVRLTGTRMNRTSEIYNPER